VDGLPWPNGAELDAWLSEARSNLPTPNQWAQLIAGLRHAAEIGRSNHVLSGLSSDATAVALAIGMIQAFFAEQEIALKYEILAPLNRLSAALTDLSEGRVNALFKPVERKPGNPGAGIAEAYIIALAARAMSALMKEGQSKEDASRKVAAALKANGGKYKNANARTVQGWRDRIHEGAGGGRIPAQALDHYNNTIPQGLNSKQLLEALKGAARLGLVESD
jgi:hypothetical protein